MSEIKNSKVVNTVFEHNFSGVYNNTAENIEIVGGEDLQGTFLFRNGANNNKIVNSKVSNARAMAIFNDKKDAEKVDAHDKLVVSRQLSLKASDFVKYGLTR